MADISDINAAQTVKVVGSDSTGVEQTPVQSTSNGAIHTNLRNNAGTEIGTAGSPVRIDPTGTTTQPISAASLPLPTGASTSALQTTGNSSLSSIDTKLTSQSTAANQSTLLTRTGDLTETAPASDTDSSGLNGRLQRIAQRITSLITTITTGTGILSTIRGNSDGTLIGNVGDKLKVIVSPINPSSLNTYKYDKDISGDLVIAQAPAWTNLLSVSAAGSLIGITIVVDSETTKVEVLLDGNIVYSFTGLFLKEVVNTDSDFKASGIFGVSNDAKRLYLTPTTPFKFNSTLLVRANNPGTGKKVKYQLITYILD